MKHEKDVWSVFRIMAEFVEGFEVLSKIEPKCITIFGSARTKKNNAHYKMTYETAKEAVKNGYGIISGGGPGIMEAANKGAYDSNGISVGLNILLPFEQYPNKFINKLINFRHFFARKVMFLKYTSAVIVMPGGFGTLDEMFEALTLIQTKKSKNMPVILMGKKYWEGLIQWLNNMMLEKCGYINKEDLNLLVTDDPIEAIKAINNFYNTEDNIKFIAEPIAFRTIENRNEYWYNKDHQLHRDNDLPAAIYANGYKSWYQNGKNHRDNDLPAVIHDNGYKAWYQNDLLHRDNDLPAIIFADGSQSWYQNGERHRDNDLPAIIDANGYQSWYKNGIQHRDNDLPAVIRTDGSQYWYKNGVRYEPLR